MNLTFLNSKTAIVKIPSSKYSGDPLELEKYAEELGQYGNIKSITTQRYAAYTNIIFILDK